METVERWQVEMILFERILNKQIKVKRKTVDDRRLKKRDFKNNVAGDYSVTCDYCQGRGHSTDKCQMLSARIASSRTQMGRGPGRPTMTCGCCQKIGHTMERYFIFYQKLRGGSGTRQRVESQTNSFNCGKIGHFASFGGQKLLQKNSNSKGGFSPS